MNTHRIFPSLGPPPASGINIILAVEAGLARYPMGAPIRIEAKIGTTIRVWVGTIIEIGSGELPQGSYDYFLINLSSFTSKESEDSQGGMEAIMLTDPIPVTVTIFDQPVEPPPDIIVDFP
jgi:hypothetical protein